MGSEMCIRDRCAPRDAGGHRGPLGTRSSGSRSTLATEVSRLGACLLYTSDAADERSSVDLGGRRIIKKKKRIQQSNGAHRMKKASTRRTKLTDKKKEHKKQMT